MQSLSEVFSESTTAIDISQSGSAKKIVDHLRSKHLPRFHDKFPNAQHEDIEDSFQDSAEKVLKEKPTCEKEMERLFNKHMDENLSSIRKKKRSINKKLSCIKSIKSQLDGHESFDELMKRAEKILTGKERKIIAMCSQGKSVRHIGKEMEISPASAWRALNNGIDKIRLSHGMKSRHLDIRKRK
jgi:DNA-directed RNA polymerase specialized sigma subunit